MKRFIAFLAFALCLLFVIFAQPAMQAAQVALSLWWNTILPTLFPFFACATLMERTGALHMLAAALHPLSKRLKLSSYALPILLLGGISGYPSGARLCGMLQSSNCISDEEAERLATVCNLCSPMFLVGIVAGGMLGDPGLFLPLAAGHYGGGLLIAIFLHVFRPIRSIRPLSPPALKGEPLYRALPRTIADGMQDMLKVGGSVVFFLVTAEALMQIGLFHILGTPLDLLFASPIGQPPSEGILLGILEMTGGCHLLSGAGLPIRTAASLCAFLISFGGLSVFVQAMAFVQFTKPMRYILAKLAHGGIAALITYGLISSRVGALEVLAPASEQSLYLTNALSGLTVLFACAVGVGAALLLALLCGRKWRKNPTQRSRRA